MLRFREGRAGDLARVEEMTRGIWGGEDYLAKVWLRWVADPRGRLRVGLLEDEVVAVGRAVELSAGHWWLEGLRVDPVQQGRGLATRMHDHTVAVARAQPGIRTLGLATSGRNEAVHHLATRSGMTRRGSYRLFKGAPLPAPQPGVHRLRDASPEMLLRRLQASQWLALSGGYAMCNWVAQPVDEEWLGRVVEGGGVWRCGAALALVGGDESSIQFWLYLLDGGAEGDQIALIRHARHLAHQHAPLAFLRAFAPTDPARYCPFLAAGMADPGDPFYLWHFMREESRSSGMMG